MLGLVAAQLKYKVGNKEVKAGKAVWVDVSIGLLFSELALIDSRSVAVLGRHERNPEVIQNI